MGQFSAPALARKCPRHKKRRQGLCLLNDHHRFSTLEALIITRPDDIHEDVAVASQAPISPEWIESKTSYRQAIVVPDEAGSTEEGSGEVRRFIRDAQLLPPLTSPGCGYPGVGEGVVPADAPVVVNHSNQT